MFEHVETWFDRLPPRVRRPVERAAEIMSLVVDGKSVATLASMAPSAMRGLILRLGRREERSEMLSGHSAHFDWRYREDFPEMRELYTRAKQNQWDADVALDWKTHVDPLNPEIPLLDEAFVEVDKLPIINKLSRAQFMEFRRSVASWMLSQFLHGEQGALYAAAQVTESVQWLDGKLYGATQVVDEGRHVEVFHRYLTTKVEKLYTVNDNLFVILDALMSDNRWDMKFLGMQIMVEGLALGAFGALYRFTREPLLRNLLRYVIQDEARHVHYGVLALKKHFAEELSDAERREREDWALEVALLMRNRFLAHEVYEEWFEGQVSRFTWNKLIEQSRGLREFRHVMFRRLIPNLRAIGLLSPRVERRYEAAGLLHFRDGADATALTPEQMIRDLESPELAAAA